MADITNKNILIPGVNSATNFVQEYAVELDLGAMAEIAATGTHDLLKLPAGVALVGLKAVVVDAVTSGGAGTVQFKVNGSAVNSTALSIAQLAKGMVHTMGVNGIAAYGENTLQLTVGTAALTGGKVLLIVETLPVDMFVTAG